MNNFSFGRTDRRTKQTERGNNNIPELSLESAGIITLSLRENYNTELDISHLLNKNKVPEVLFHL